MGGHFLAFRKKKENLSIKKTKKEKTKGGYDFLNLFFIFKIKEGKKKKKRTKLVFNSFYYEKHKNHKK